MPRVYVRGRKFWADCYYFDADSGERVRKERSTGIRDDGTAQSRRTAERVARDIEASLATGQSRRARGTPIASAYASLVDAKTLAGKADATIAITVEKSSHVLRFFRGRDCESLTDADLKAYALHATQKRKAPTVERELRELCLALKSVNVAPPKMPELAKSKPRERWLTVDERVRLLEQVMPRWREHVVMYMQLGLSKSELFHITPGDVDLDRNTVHVRGTKAKSRDRVMPMPLDVRLIIERRLHLLASDHLRNAQSLGKASKQVDLVIAPIFGRWNPGNADRHLRLAARRAGLGRLSFNDLRRTFATALAREGFTALQLKPLMGHTSTRMLDQVYARMGIGAEAQHVVDALPVTPEDAREQHGRGVPAWNKGVAMPGRKGHAAWNKGRKTGPRKRRDSVAANSAVEMPKATVDNAAGQKS